MPYAMQVTGRRYCLIEASRREIAEASQSAGVFVAGARKDGELIAVTAAAAHRWVKAGGLHATGLWVDDAGRVRYARATA